jgi:hypothetical protein
MTKFEILGYRFNIIKLYPALTSKSADVKRCYERKYKNGICRRCQKKRLNENIYCEEHLVEERKYSRNRQRLRNKTKPKNYKGSYKI